MNATVTIVIAAMFLVPVGLLLSPAVYAATRAGVALSAAITRRATEATPIVPVGAEGIIMNEVVPAEPAAIPVYDLA